MTNEKSRCVARRDRACRCGTPTTVLLRARFARPSRTWEQVKADKYAYGPKQEYLDNGETQIDLPYGQKRQALRRSGRYTLSDATPGAVVPVLIAAGPGDGQRRADVQAALRPTGRHVAVPGGLGRNGPGGEHRWLVSNTAKTGREWQKPFGRNQGHRQTRYRRTARQRFQGHRPEIIGYALHPLL